MSRSPDSQEADAAAQYLRDLLVRFLVDAAASEPRVMQASSTLEQVVHAALTRHDAGLNQQLARIERELAAVRALLQQPPVDPAQQDLALTLQHVRGEVALLNEHVQRLSRGLYAQKSVHDSSRSGTGTGASRLWAPALITLVCGAALVYLGYVALHRHGPQQEARPPLQLQSPAQPPASLTPPSEPTRPRSATPPVTQGAVRSAVSSAAQPVAASRASLSWEQAWDQAVTQAFNCPEDPGASTLLQCACPDVHPAPPAGYPYEGVGERCPPGPAWNGRLAIAALQAILTMEEPEVPTHIDGLAQHLYPALNRLAERCSLRPSPEVLPNPDGPDAGAAAVRVLSFLRSNPDCLSER